MSKKQSSGTYCYISVKGMSINGVPVPDSEYEMTEINGKVTERGTPPAGFGSMVENIREKAAKKVRTQKRISK